MAELVQVRIKGTVVTHRYGTLSSGDVLRTDAAFAKHLVEDCSAAEYLDKVSAPKTVETETTEQPQAEEPQAAKPSKGKKK